MNILVVGRGDAGKTDPTFAGHKIVFIDTPPKGAPAPDLDQYDFAFFHFSHDKKRGKEYADILNSWKNGQVIHKVILISAGNYPYEWEDNERIINLGSPPFLEGIHSPQAIRDLSWENVPINFKGNAHELVSLLKPRTMQFLPALIILCQAYLAAHALHLKLDVKENDVLRALNQMECTESLKNIIVKLNKGDIEKNWKKVQTSDWWWDDFADDKNAALNLMQEQIDHEWRNRPDVFNTLFDMFKGERVDQPSVVAQVYCAISDKFRGRL